MGLLPLFTPQVKYSFIFLLIFDKNIVALKKNLCYNTFCKSVAGLCNGSTNDSGSFCEGSNPSPAANNKYETSMFCT